MTDLLELLKKAYVEYADHSFECSAYDGEDEGVCDCGYAILAEKIDRLWDGTSRSQLRKETKMLVPQKIDDAMFAFPANVIGTLLPEMEKIPEEFKKKSNPWVVYAAKWFYDGGTSLNFEPKEGIVVDDAFRHLSACLRSYEPKHEHKMAGVGYLMSEFFMKVHTDDEKTTAGS